MSKHATERALDMAVDGEAIRDVLDSPQGAHEHPDYPGCEMWTRGRICLAVNPVERVVITVMWATRGRMDREDNDEAFWRD
ncbi:hypothetical protein ACWD2L_06190 [Streptomyces sp. NPDC002754]